ncbi:MAG: C25 family cysteine peptidase [Anaerolineales bacterium]
MKKLVYGILILSLLNGFLPLKTLAQTEPIENAGFQLVQANETGVIIEYYFGDYAFEKVELDGEIFDRILLQDGSTIGDPGKPNLPLVATSIGVPLEAEFTLQIEEIQTKPLSGRYRVEPAPIYVAGDEDLALGAIRYQLDESTYTSSDPFPGKFVEIGEAAKLRSQRILPLRVYPFQYMPSSGELEALTKVRFRINFNYPHGVPAFESSSALAEDESPFETIYQQNLLNYQEAKRYRAFEPPVEAPTQLLSEGSTAERYKITVTEDGIYKLTYETLQAAGMPVSTLNPQTFAMTNQGRPVAIYVENSDGNATKFSSGEFILFFGEKFDGTYLASLYSDEDDFWRDSFYRSGELNLTPFAPRFNRYMVEKYTNKNVYWLSYGGVGGPFMEQMTVSAGNAPFLESFQSRIRFEEQNVWWTTHFTSEDTFFWEGVQFSNTISKDYTLSVPNPTQSGTAILRGEFVSKAHSPSVNPDHRQIIYINKSQNPTPIGTLTWDGLRRYRFELTFPASYLVHGNNTLTVEFQKVTGMIVDQIFVDWFEISYEQKTIAQGNQIAINRHSVGIESSPSSNYKIYLPLILKNYSPLNSLRVHGFTQQPVALQISDPLKPRLINGANFANGELTFNSENLDKKFFIGVPRTTVAIEQVTFEDIINSRADYIYIAPKEFIQAAQNLANYRQTSDGFMTKVVALEEIINQFNFGIYHPRAIKNYLQDVYNRWSPKPTYVLLIGDGHWNFLGSTNYDNPLIYMPPNLQWVDPWQGEVDSANDLATVDGWDPLADLLIGRLPVNSGAEIAAYLTKVQTYEGSSDKNWQKRFVFVADANDPAAGNFPQMMDQVISAYPISDLHKIYLNKSDSSYTSYNTESQSGLPCGSQQGSNQCPNATQTLLSLLNGTSGVGHLVYSGHGYIDGWSKAVVFSNPDVENLNNPNFLPIALTLDCLDGYWYYPQINAADHRGQAIIEIMVRTSAKGAVAAFAPTGLGVATAHDKLQRGFYNTIFINENWRLGNATLAAKLKVYQDTPLHVDLVHTYTVFGDPALNSVGINSP